MTHIAKKYMKNNIKNNIKNYIKTLKKLIAVAIISAQFFVNAHAFLPAGGPAETWTIGTIVTVVSAVISQVSSMAANLFMSMQNSFDRTMSAMSIATKQEAINSQQIVNNIQQTSENFIAGIRYQQQSANGLKAWVSYSPQTGQGVNVCGSLAEQQSILNASLNVERNVANHIQNLPIDNAAGSIVENPDQLVAARIKKYSKYYCSKEDEAQGRCSVDDVNLANANVSADLLFKNIEKDSPADQARIDYIENIMGVPTAYEAKPGSVEAMNYILNKSQKDAFLSIPNYSLNYIRLQNTKQKDGEDSLNTQMQKKVEKYVAGPAATEWNRTLATQSERGLMIEMLKMQANQTWLKQKQFEDQLRQEATLAALLLLANKNKEATLSQNFADTR